MEVLTTLGDAIISASFEALFDNLRKEDWLKYARDRHVEGEVKNWKIMLDKIHEFLEDMEWKVMADGSVKWFSELRHLAYDLEDILDDFATRKALRSLKLEEEQAASTSMVRKFRSPTCFACLNLSKFKFNVGMIGRMREITEKLEGVIKIKDTLPLSDGGRGKTYQKRERNETTSVLEEKETRIYGRKEDQQEILQLLKDDAAASGEGVSVIAIVGMGGMGKTTLAQLIYNDATLDFDCKAWTSVGTEAFDVRGVTQSILQCLRPKENIVNNDLNWLQTELKKELHQKKCLIVLDDVWHETQFYSHWTQFRAPLLGWAPESRIIVTTRDERVSSMMGAVGCRSLGELSQNDCLSVLAQHAFGVNNFNGHPDLKEIGDKIARRCKGLPLAAKTLGGLLRGSPDPKAWEDLLHSNVWDSGTEILPALMLSYIHLPSHLKPCFAYFSVFPKDFEVGRNELVLLWMAEGFVNGKDGEMQGLGCKYFDELLSRSLLQQSSGNKSQYVMHDLIHDLAQSVSRGVCFHLGDRLEDNIPHTKFRHSSFLSGYKDRWRKFANLSKMQSLRTFLALPILNESGFKRLSSKVLHEIVLKLRFLRVLSLAGYGNVEVPSSINCLTHLRYLSLSSLEIERLPEEVAELFNLQTLILRGCFQIIELPSRIGNLINLHSLDISGCYQLTKLPQGISNLINLHSLDMSFCSGLTELPQDISKLINLSCLDMSGCSKLNKLPAQIGKLTNLHTLGDFIVGKESGAKLTELRKLSKVKGKLRIRELQNVVDIRDADCNLKEKGGIEELKLEWTHDFSGSRNNSNSVEVGVLNLLRPPHQKLSSLFIDNFGGTELPSWLGDPIFSKLVELQLSNCKNITSLPPLGQLPSLRGLWITGMNGVKEVRVELHECYATLETLSIWDMEEWEQWNWSSNGTNEEAAVRFSKLRELEVIDCPKLVGKLPSCLPSLQKLRIGGCQGVLVNSMSDFTSLTTLDIWSISGLESLDEAHIENLGALRDLRIW